jgi:tetratricopeptide (TPR) repeat protein
MLKPNQEAPMKNTCFGLLSSILFLFTGCASFQASQNFQSGRQAFITGKYDAAQSYFRNAAQIDPGYINYNGVPQGIWSYVGRADYATGRLTDARQALERAISIHSADTTARLYLGLTLAREGDRQRSLKEISLGMKGIYDWLEDIARTQRFSSGRYWDPKREIRSEIQTTLAMISRPEIDWPKVLQSGDWVGRTMEEEIDRAQRDEDLDRSRQSEGGGDEP